MNYTDKLAGFVVLLAVFTACSCSSTRNINQDSLYNRHNEIKVKVKSGLFSSKHVSFGNYSTDNKENGVDKHIIDFQDQNDPFNFAMNDNHGNVTSVQAVYTKKKDLPNNNLPTFFDTTREVSSIYYSWIRGGAANTLQNWELILQSPTYEGLQHDSQTGVLRTTGQIIAVHANNRFGTSGSYQNICYEFRIQGVAVAAVQINGKNKVWMVQQLNNDTKFAIAGAIASLLMR